MPSTEGTLKPRPPSAPVPSLLISSGRAAVKVPAFSKKVRVLAPTVKDTICGPATVRHGLAAPPHAPWSGTPPAAGFLSKVGLFRYTTWLFVHLAPPWQLAHCVSKT